MPAQGNALGNHVKESTSPEGARQGVTPFQGWVVFALGTQGGALGWHVFAPLVLTFPAELLAIPAELLTFPAELLTFPA